MKTEKVKISQVKTNPNNPRLIKDDKFKKLVRSIKEFPEMLEIRPIVVDKDNIVLGGNMRLRACKEAGLKEIDIVKADQLTKEQQREFIIKDNVGFGEWDWDDLANEWEVEKLEDWGLDLPLDLSVEELEAEEDDYEMPNEIKTDIVLGDLIEIGEHRLLCGDSTCSDTVAKLMNGEKADMVFTDPPYNMSYSGAMGATSKDGVMIKQGDYNAPSTKHNPIHNDKIDNKEFYDFMSDTLKEIKLNCTGAFYICFGSQTLNQLLQPFIDLGMEYKSIIIWMKNQSAISGKDYKSKYEPIIYGRFNNIFHGEKYNQEDIWEFQRTLKNDLHPTMKPILLIQNALNNSSKLGMIILDLFLGSGSTMVAAHQLKRKCYGMELDAKYCQVIVERMLNLDSALEVKINGEVYRTNTE